VRLNGRSRPEKNGKKKDANIGRVLVKSRAGTPRLEFRARGRGSP